MDSNTLDPVWDYIYKMMKFAPRTSGCNDVENLIHLPNPSLCYNIEKFYDDGYREDYYDDLHEKVIIWFKNVCKDGVVYGLDWQHDCYSFSVNQPFERDEFGEWLIPAFPNGDYVFFVAPDLKNGIFGDGINLQFYIWGEEFVAQNSGLQPAILQNASPCNGKHC